MRTIKAWHFLPDDKRMRYGDHELVEVGKTYRAIGDIELCENGMHGSERFIDALQYAPGSIVCKVAIWGEVVRGDDKLAGRNRKVLAMADATMVLHEFACRCAEDALKVANVTDKRCWDAIDAKRKWMRGEISDSDLAAARYAARAAATDAARAAAWAAATAAAWAAARDAAWAAARDAQNTVLVEMVEELFEVNR